MQPVIVFFLMILRPPRSTLFPTRRSSDLTFELGEGGRLEPELCSVGAVCVTNALSWLGMIDEPMKPAPRSEEHTSELQSQSNLVCRLLLEKKKKHKNRTQNTTQ